MRDNDFDFGVEHISFEDSTLGRIQKTALESAEESKKINKKQNRLSNIIQILTLFVGILTLAATIWFGIKG